MTYHFRQLTLNDCDAFLALTLKAYEPIRQLGIHFDAATADRERASLHLQNHGVYALFLDEQMVSTATVRYPWGPLPGPFGLPHIGWFATHPDYKGQQLGKKMLSSLEHTVLDQQLKAPAVSLGTAESHPWLAEMYQRFGYQVVSKADLGKGHITLYMKKVLNEARHQQWQHLHAARG